MNSCIKVSHERSTNLTVSVGSELISVLHVRAMKEKQVTVHSNTGKPKTITGTNLPLVVVRVTVCIIKGIGCFKSRKTGISER